MTRVTDNGAGHSPSNEGLYALGLNDRITGLFAPLQEQGMSLARVVRVDRGLPLVHLGTEILRAEPAPHLIKSAKDSMSRAVVGDWIALARPEGHELWIIEVILPRSSAFVRKDPGERVGEQVVAANIDCVFVMQSAREINLRRLERELVLAWDSGAQPVVVLTKGDLFTGDVAELVDSVSDVSPGVEVLFTSAVTGLGLERVRELLGPGVTGAFLGASGVGKSTLVNALVGSDVQQIAEVREADGKGRHTTVAREIISLSGAGVVIDTPGMRALALWDVEYGMAAAFSDIRELADRCRFGDCAHVDEPGCAVLEAVDAGHLLGRRLDSYRDLRDELDELARRRERKSWQREGKRRR